MLSRCCTDAVNPGSKRARRAFPDGLLRDILLPVKSLARLGRPRDAPASPGPCLVVDVLRP